MTHERPNERVPRWALGLLKAAFLMALGYIGNQFWVIPVQQAHQDDAIRVLIERMDRDEATLKSFGDQHQAMIKEIDRNSRKLDDITKTLEDHERRDRIRAGKH